MKRLLAFTAALALSFSVLVAPAEAATQKQLKPTVEITTRYAVARGDYYYDEYAKTWVVFRPLYTLSAAVVCPAGETYAFEVSPYYAMTIPGFNFTCTGKRQAETFTATGAMPAKLGLSIQKPTATLSRYTTDGVRTPVDTDSERILVLTVPRTIYP